MYFWAGNCGIVIRKWYTESVIDGVHIFTILHRKMSVRCYYRQLSALKTFVWNSRLFVISCFKACCLHKITCQKWMTWDKNSYKTCSLNGTIGKYWSPCSSRCGSTSRSESFVVRLLHLQYWTTCIAFNLRRTLLGNSW